MRVAARRMAGHAAEQPEQPSPPVSNSSSCSPSKSAGISVKVDTLHFTAFVLVNFAHFSCSSPDTVEPRYSAFEGTAHIYTL